MCSQLYQQSGLSHMQLQKWIPVSKWWNGLQWYADVHFLIKRKGGWVLICPFLQQISMSATITMVAVHKPVPTQMAHFSAAVTLGLDWTVTEELAMVSIYHGTVLFHRWILRVLTFITALSHLPPSLSPSLHSAINQCAEGTHNCSQLCINDGGSFRCSCNAGFQLGTDGASCTGMYLARVEKERRERVS